MNIRKMEINDVIKVLTCNVSNIPENYYLRYWTSMLTEWPELSFLAEDERGKVVGYVLSSIEDDVDDPDLQVGHINSLSVHRPYRRLGLARKLMTMTKEAMLREDVPLVRIQLHVRNSNRPARTLYNKLGYEAFDHENAYYSDGEDANVMRIQVKSPSIETPTGRPRRTRKTWLAQVWHFIHYTPSRFAEAAMARLRRRNSHP